MYTTYRGRRRLRFQPAVAEVAYFYAYSCENLAPQSITVEVFGISCKLIGLDALILAKRAAGRPKDLEDLAELEMLRERRKREAAG
jgi:predicted nucleotidyltransferase